MTKMHFIAFARYIHDSPLPVETRQAMAEMVIAVQDNPRFDRDRFLAACGLGQKQLKHPIGL